MDGRKSIYIYMLHIFICCDISCDYFEKIYEYIAFKYLNKNQYFSLHIFIWYQNVFKTLFTTAFYISQSMFNFVKSFQTMQD